MTDYQQYFQHADVQLYQFYMYFLFVAVLAAYLVFKSNSKYKIELFFISFYLLTGNLNKLLTTKIPGFGLIEIQPSRFLYFLLFFLIVRKMVFSRTRFHLTFDKKMPWFQMALLAYVILLMVSVLVNSAELGMVRVLDRIVDTMAFLVIMVSLSLMKDKHSYNLIGKSMIIGAVISSVVSIIQLSFDHYFLRIGDARIAFDGLLRSNGIFETEYFNSYYLIIAIAWTLIKIKNNYLKMALVSLFTLGVLTSFQRMSWLIVALVIVTYLAYIKKVALEKLVLIGLTGFAVLLSLSIFYYQEIANSALVRERLTDSVQRREGYYWLVLDNIGEKPLFGFGNLKNDIYYNEMLRITGDRNRAMAVTGDLHSGYFSALFLYGIPAFVCFLLFVLLSVFYYASSYKVDKYFAIPFLVSIIYMIANLTNTFLFLTYIAILFAIHIGIGMGINQIQENSAS